MADYGFARKVVDAAEEQPKPGAPLVFTPADELRRRRPLGPAVPTGLPILDDFLEGGLRPGHAVLVGAPESGKTSFATHCAVRFVEAAAAHAALVYARDEAPGAFVNRLAQRLGFDRTKLRQNDPETCEAAAAALASRWGDRILLLDPYLQPLDAAREKAAEMRSRGPLAVIVDSLQVAVTTGGAKASSQKDRIDAAMSFGSELASHGDLVLSLSQSSRAGYAEPKNGRDPRAEGSGSAGIEFNADLLLGFKSRAEDDPTAPRTVTVMKGRGGLGKGTVSFVIDRETTVIREVDRSAAEEAESHAVAAKLRPYQDAVLAELRKAAAAGEKRSKNFLEQHVKGGASQIRAALKALVISGDVFVEEGPRGALLYYAARSPEATSSDFVSTSSRPRPDEVDDDPSDDLVSSSLPVRGDEVGETRSTRAKRGAETSSAKTQPRRGRRARP
ncbi:MAG: DnaB-like helicase C-terminal domain-containing protein [Thermoanaerobaculia bacterium]